MLSWYPSLFGVRYEGNCTFRGRLTYIVRNIVHFIVQLKNDIAIS